MTKAEAQKRLSTLNLQEKDLFKKMQAARKVYASFSDLGRALRQHEVKAQSVAGKELKEFSWEYTYVRMEIDSLTTMLSWFA